MSAAPARRLSETALAVWRLQLVVVWLGLTVAGIVVAGQVDALGPLWWIVPVVGGAVATYAIPKLRFARWRWDINDEGIDIQRGALALVRTLVPWIRVQHVDTQRGLFEQAFGLSTVVVHTAAGSHTIPMLPAAEADELRTRIAGLARTEEEEEDAERADVAET
jgi:membrane protein YdbS with pleckstrin-like domain